MAWTATRQDVREEARRRADQVNSDFRSDADINKLIDQTNTEVQEHIDIVQPERNLASFTINTIVGQDTYAFGVADVGRLKDLEANIAGRVRTLDYFQWQDRNRYQDALGWDLDSPVAWRARGTNIVFAPRPSVALAVTVWYHPVPFKFANDGTAYDMDCGRFEALVVGVAWKLALMESDHELGDRLGAEYQRQLQRILDIAAVRVTEHVEVARDVYARDLGDRW